MWLTVVMLVGAVLWLGAARWTVFVNGAGTETLLAIGLSLISFAVLMVSFVAIVLAVALGNPAVRRFGTVVAALAAVSAVASLLGF